MSSEPRCTALAIRFAQEADLGTDLEMVGAAVTRAERGDAATIRKRNAPCVVGDEADGARRGGGAGDERTL